MSIHQTAIIDKGAELGKNVTVGPYSVIEGNTVIGDDTVLDNNVTVKEFTRMGSGNRVHSGAVIGGIPQDLKFSGEETKLIIGDRNVFREYVTVHRGTELGGGKTAVGNNNLIMCYCHVGHDCIIEDNVIMSSFSGLAGHVRIQDFAIISGHAAVHQFATIGRYAFVCGKAGVSRDVPPYMLVEGIPAKVRGVNIVGLKRKGMGRDVIDALKTAYRTIFRSEKSISQSIEDLNGGKEKDFDEVKELIEFLAKSETGVQGRARETGRSAEIANESTAN